MKIIELTFCLLAMSSAAPAQAEPVFEEAPKGVSVPKEIAEMYQENRRARVLPVYSDTDRSIDETAEAREVDGDLISAADGMVMLAFAVVPEMKESMLQRGTRAVSSKGEIANDVIFDGRWYRVFHATAEATGLEDDRLVGRRVRATLVRALNGQYLLSDLRGL